MLDLGEPESERGADGRLRQRSVDDSLHHLEPAEPCRLLEEREGILPGVGALVHLPTA
jgi:hypothetical protein